MCSLYDRPSDLYDDPEDPNGPVARQLVATLTHNGLIPVDQIPRGRADQLLYRWRGLVPPTIAEIEAALEWFPTRPTYLHGGRVLFLREPVAHTIPITPDEYLTLTPDQAAPGLLTLTVVTAAAVATVALNPAHVHHLRVVLALLDPTVRVPKPPEAAR